MNRVVIGRGRTGRVRSRPRGRPAGSAEVTVVDRDGLGVAHRRLHRLGTCTDPSGIRARRRLGRLDEEERQSQHRIDGE